MSIFTHTFPKYVRQQLEDREAILKIGDNLSENRFTSSGNAPGKIYPPGSYYTNSTEKQCVIRLCSGVDLTPEGENNILSGKTEKDKWRGENLAKNWILEGGMPDPLIATDDNLDELNEARKRPHETNSKLKKDEIASFTPRGGFSNPEKRAYGDPLTRSDAGDGYGIVPMPGIIDAKVKVKSAYGSLREAQVNFVCHNRRQLAILELLYMRPGYTLLLEWGWSPHIKTSTLKDGSDGPVIKSEDFFVMNQFFNSDTTFEELNAFILEKKKKSGGNYDAMCGYIKNFEIKVRDDGGYDCSTTIISMGELLEGLKGRADFGEIKSNEDEEGRVYDNFEVYIMALQQKMKADQEFDTYQDKNLFSKALSEYHSFFGMKTGYKDQIKRKTNPFDQESRNNVNKLDHDISAIFKTAFTSIFSKDSDIQLFKEGERVETEAESSVNEEDINDVESNETYVGKYKVFGKEIDVGGSMAGSATNYILNHFNTKIKRYSASKKILEEAEKNDALDHFLLHKGERLGLGKDGDYTLGESQHNYIRWDLLCEIMNEFVLDNATDPKEGAIKKKLAKLAYTNDGEESPDDSGTYLEYSNYSFDPPVKIPIDLKSDSADSTESSQAQGYGIINVDLSECMDGSLNPSICLFPHQINPNSDSKKKLGTCLLGKAKWFETGKGFVSATNRAIGLIYINIDYLLETYTGMRYDEHGGDREDWSVLGFIKKIWEEDITGACAGTHNFIFQMPNSVGRIIDVDFNGTEPLNVHTLKIQDKNSIVRTFNFNTQIDKKLSSTIAIAAQSPKSITNIDQLSFAAFNKDISNRFVTNEIEPDKAKADRETLEKDVVSYASQLYNYQLNMVSQEGDDNDKENQTINVENAVQKIQSLQEKVIKLTLTYPLKCGKKDPYPGCEPGADHPAAGQRRHKATISRSSIIPLKFNCQMDGIGGIVIGNIFKLPSDKLPMGYNGDDIAFVVMGINHKITEGQDWVTELSGQLILLNSGDTMGEQTTMSVYNVNDLLDHSVGGKRFNKTSSSPVSTIVDGVEIFNRPPNVQKIVDLVDNDYSNPILPIKLAPGGNKLNGFLSEKVGSTSPMPSTGERDPFPQMDSAYFFGNEYGDISPQLADVAVKVFSMMKEWTDNPPGQGDREEWTGEKNWRGKIRDKEENFYHVTITGANDQYHVEKNPNSNHCQGMGLDFVTSPKSKKYRNEIESILQKFVVMNEGRFRFINEYERSSSAKSGDHWHITWYPSGRGGDGKADMDIAFKREEDGELWYKNRFGIETESKKRFKINTIEYTRKSQEELLSSSPYNCFVAGTLITMADGSQKNIENIKEGDIIQSENGTSNVTKLIINNGEFDVYSINNSKPFVTAEHPFKTTNGWKSITPSDLHGITTNAFNEGDKLITLNNIEKITSINVSKEKVNTVYNLSVDNEHVYYANNYLVHNKM